MVIPRFFKGWLHTKVEEPEESWDKCFGWIEGDLVYKCVCDAVGVDDLEQDGKYELTAAQLSAMADIYAKQKHKNDYVISCLNNAAAYLDSGDNDDDVLVFHVEILHI